MNRSELVQRLSQYGIAAECWGGDATRTVDDLLAEILAGETTLEEIDGRLVRNVRVACIQLYYNHSTRGRLKLREMRQVFWTGKERTRSLPHSLSEKLQRDEDPKEAAFGGLKEELRIPCEAFCLRVDNAPPSQDPRTYKTSYPGLESRHHLYHYVAELVDPRWYNEHGYIEVQLDKMTFFEWEVVKTRLWPLRILRFLVRFMRRKIKGVP